MKDSQSTVDRTRMQALKECVAGCRLPGKNLASNAQKKRLEP